MQTQLPLQATPVGWDATAALANGIDWKQLFTTQFTLDAIELSGLRKEREFGNPISVLDIACGVGAMALTASESLGNNDFVLATDFSPKMIEEAKKNVHKSKATNVKCEVMDGQNLTLDDNSFNFVYSLFGVMFFPDKSKGFSEIRRVLKKGGVATIAVWTDKVGTIDIMRATVAKYTKEHPEISPPKGMPGLSLADRNYFQQQLKEAGFSEISIHEINHSWKLENYEEFIKIMGQNPFLVDTANGLQTTPEVLSEYARKVLQEKYPFTPFEIMEMTASIAVVRK